MFVSETNIPENEKRIRANESGMHSLEQPKNLDYKNKIKLVRVVLSQPEASVISLFARH